MSASSKAAGARGEATIGERIYTRWHPPRPEATTQQALLIEIYAERERLRRADRQRQAQLPKDELPSQRFAAQQHTLRSSESIGALLWRVNPGSRNNLFLSSINPNQHM